MKIRVFPREDGLVDVYFQRNMPLEGRNIFLKGIAQDALEGAVAEGVQKMREKTKLGGTEDAL